MQLPTHLIVGIVIQAVLTKNFSFPEWITILLTIILAFFSHFFVDSIAKMTYHPPERIEDNFWLIWHVFILLFGIVIFLVFMWKYAIGMLFANLVDIWDWLTLRKIAKRKGQPEWGKRYYLHPFANKIRSTFFFWLPNLSYNRVGILPEVLLYLSWILLIILNPQLL